MRWRRRPMRWAAAALASLLAPTVAQAQPVSEESVRGRWTCVYAGEWLNGADAYVFGADGRFQRVQHFHLRDYDGDAEYELVDVGAYWLEQSPDEIRDGVEIKTEIFMRTDTREVTILEVSKGFPETREEMFAALSRPPDTPVTRVVSSVTEDGLSFYDRVEGDELCRAE